MTRNDLSYQFTRKDWWATNAYLKPKCAQLHRVKALKEHDVRNAQHIRTRKQ
jgi:hypothetical protein